jgi:hypothetical protein
MSKEPEPRARRQAARRVVDWHRAAELLAGGMTITTVAERIGCSPTTLSRKRMHDPDFQKWMASCGRARGEEDGLRLAALRTTLEGAIEIEVGAGNVRVILWLADRLKLVTPPNARTPEQELRNILGCLTADELSEVEELRDDL